MPNPTIDQLAFSSGRVNPLKLLMYGEVVRVAGNTIAVEVTGHAFHTAGRAMQHA
jgi:hypothetical protein